MAIRFPEFFQSIHKLLLLVRTLIKLVISVCIRVSLVESSNQVKGVDVTP